MKPEGALTLGINTDLSETAMIEMARLLPASKWYTLWVAAENFAEGKRTLRTLAVSVQDNPFAPWVNLKVHPDFAAYEWAIQVLDSGHIAWSPGA